MPTVVQDILAEMERIAPPWLACADDPAGFHAGERQAPVERVLLALDATPDVVAEAKALGVQLLVVHHPRIYAPLKTLATETAAARALTEAVKAGIAIYSAHTALDIVAGGINDLLADAAGLPAAGRQPISTEVDEPLYKLVVYLPEDARERLSAALWTAGAGHIGNYSHCSFFQAGTGTFLGHEGSHPAIGTPGHLEQVREARAEYIVPESKLAACTEALRQVHPYEEPAFDLVVLRQTRRFGLGRWGSLSSAVKLNVLARQMQQTTASPQAQLFGDPERPVQRVGVWCGGGFPEAKAGELHLDAIVVGELGYHALEQLAMDRVGAIVLGHGPSEEIVLPSLQEKLQAAFPALDIRIATSKAPALCNF